jgi:hypothetical protein
MAWLAILATNGASLAVSREERREWPLTSDELTMDSADAFAECMLDAYVSASKELLLLALPELVSVLKGVRSVSIWQPIAIVVAEIIDDDDWSRYSDYDAVLELAELQVGAGMDLENYAVLVKRLETIWGRQQAPRTLPWLLQALDILAVSPCPDASLRLGFFHVSLASLRRWMRHLSRAEVRFFALVCNDLEQTDIARSLLEEWTAIPENSQQGEPKRPVLRALHFAIYSISKQICARLQELLLEVYPDLKISICNDKYGSPRLKQLSKSVDVFLVNTWDATHAATNTIKAHRPKDRVLLQPKQKNAPALFRCFEDWVNTDAA